MSEKTDSKKKYIIEKATEVFAAKGFRSVTMKDVVEACGISRGGLYLYFSSTEELFLEVVKTAEEKEDEGKDMAKMLDESSCGELLVWFIKEQKKEIMRRKNSLSVAKFEYAFYCKEQNKTSMDKTKFETAVKVLEKLLERGNEAGEFVCDNPKAVASNMMYTIVGLRATAASYGITEKKVDAELVHMMRQFMEV